MREARDNGLWHCRKGKKKMNIYGLQKMTLLDFPGRVACTVFLTGCDMRCPFCHNSELAENQAPPVMTDEELLRFLKTRRGLLDGVAVTGGEPLLREENLDLLRKIRELGFPIKLDTNGTHPDRLRRAAAEGLIAYAAMDIKNSPERYAETIGLPSFDLGPVRESAAFLMSSGLDFEFRTTVVRELHDAESFRAIVIVDAVDAADMPVRTLHQLLPDKGGQHDALGPGIQGHEDNTVRIAVAVQTLAVFIDGHGGTLRALFDIPGIHAQQQIMVLAIDDGGKLIIGYDFNGQGIPLRGEPLPRRHPGGDALYRGALCRRGSVSQLS